jgi:hypothetical protein
VDSRRRQPGPHDRLRSESDLDANDKRLAARVAPLPIKPDRLVERIEQALTESDPRRALRLTTELQLDAVLLAPSGPNVDRARTWLAEGMSILRSGESGD